MLCVDEDVAAAGGVGPELTDDVDARPAPESGAADGMGDDEGNCVDARSCAGVFGSCFCLRGNTGQGEDVTLALLPPSMRLGAEGGSYPRSFFVVVAASRGKGGGRVDLARCVAVSGRSLSLAWLI